MSTESVKLIAFYLPQFHPIPENDAWWGKGFTEWTNVTRATPLYEEHYQPHLPADLGFYDLRLNTVRHEQIRLAKQYGIDGFCYHYYWFSGKRLLEAPLNDMLADTQSNMPFCLCWANENWTRRWDAQENHILIAQRYLPEDDLNFIKSVEPFLRDERYIKIDGKPLLIVYRPQHMPDAQKSASIWREYCKKQGIGDLHLCAALTHGNNNYSQFAFDSGLQFPPHNLQLENQAKDIRFYHPFSGFTVDQPSVARDYLSREYLNKKVFRGVFPAWDNTARRNHQAVVITHSSPENYEYWLSKTIEYTKNNFKKNEQIVFINAWNEWAEGCHLEPDQRYKHQYLEATIRAKNGMSTLKDFSYPSRQNKEEVGFFSDLAHVFYYHIALCFGKGLSFLKKFPRLRKSIQKIVYKFW